jgi:hypothetical protein
MVTNYSYISVGRRVWHQRRLGQRVRVIRKTIAAATALENYERSAMLYLGISIGYGCTRTYWQKTSIYGNGGFPVDRENSFVARRYGFPLLPIPSVVSAPEVATKIRQ